MIDAGLQAAAIALVLYGSWESGNQRNRANAAKLVGSIATTIVSVNHEVWGTAILTFILIWMQTRGLVKWYKLGTPW